LAVAPALAIFGAGAWGTGLGIALAREGREVMLLPHRTAHATALRTTRTNAQFLPGLPFPPGLQVGLDATEAQAPTWVLAMPLASLRSALQALAPHYTGQALVWLCKGFEPDSAKLPHEVVRETLPTAPAAVLTGPSFAQEVAQGLPAALTLACDDAAVVATLLPQFHCRALRIYASDDLLGCELGGALKNVMAIATGIADGMGLGLNARAALMTRGLAELTRLGVAMGARPETFMGLTGLGDLLLTCTGALSRNRTVGLALGQGQTLQAALETLGHVAEGVNAAREAAKLATHHQVDMPIVRAVNAVLFDQANPAQALAQLMARDARRE
jgi:glycerol-3-phosphate dehydrogenase (NAD(P)+)